MFSILEVGSEWNEINRRRKSYLNRFPELSTGCYAKLPFKLLLQRQLEARLSPPSSLPALPFGGPSRSPSSVSTAPSGPCYTYAEVLRRSKGLLARPQTTSRSSPSSSPSFPSFSHPLIHGSRPSSLHLRFLHLSKPLFDPTSARATKLSGELLVRSFLPHLSNSLVEPLDPHVEPFTRGSDGLDRFDRYIYAAVSSSPSCFRKWTRRSWSFLPFQTPQSSKRTAEEWRREYRRRDYYFVPMVAIMRREKRRWGVSSP